MSVIIRWVLLAVVRLFYARRAVVGREHVPKDGPVLVVGNHPNGLLDPLVIRSSLHRPVGLLGKSTLFANPFGRAAGQAFNAIPVYRQKDGQDTSKNDETFRLCRQRFKEGGWLAMFPEGVSHTDPMMRPLKTGAARIALSAEAENNWSLNLRILPVGLLYDARETFRSAVAVSVGPAIPLAPYRQRYEADQWETVEALTKDIALALGKVTLEAESSELWKGFLAVAAWTSPEAADDLSVQEERARRLARAWQALGEKDPELAQGVADHTRRFVRLMETVGVQDPWKLEGDAASALQVSKSLVSVMLLWPLALLGAVLGWLPYRAIKPLAEKLSQGEVDVISTIKVLLGMLTMTLWYLLEAVLAGLYGGPLVGLATLVVAPLSGFVALRFDERVALRRELLRAFWLRATGSQVAAAVTRERARLVELVEQALGRVR